MRKHKKGFTIVELVIVIAVIGILSAILIPTFVNVTQNAKDAALQSDLSTSYSMYAAEAADWVVGDTETEIAFKAQAEVELSKGEEVYHFDNDAKKWDKGHISNPTGTLTYVVTIKKTVNNAEVDDPVESEKQSTFGDYTVMYYVEPKPTSTEESTGESTEESTGESTGENTGA